MSRYLVRPKNGKEMQAETEAKDIHQWVQNLGKKKASSNEKTKNLFQHQQKQMSSLIQEEREMYLNIHLNRTDRNNSLDIKNTKELQEIIKTQHFYDSLLKLEKAHVANLDLQVKEMTEIMEKQKSVAPPCKNVQEICKSHKTINILEAQLQHVNMQFNETLAKNTRLRQEINHLRYQRANYSKFQQRLQNQLNQYRLVIDNTMKQATWTNNKREEILAKILVLKEKTERAIKQYYMEMKENVLMFEGESKLETFMQTKNFDRSTLEDGKRTFKKEGGSEREDFVNQTEYEKLVQQCTEPYLKSLKKQFIQNEGNNSSSLRLLCELNNEIEMLEHKIKVLEDGIVHFNHLWFPADMEKHCSLKPFQTKLLTADEGNISKNSNDFLSHLKESVEGLFNMINCDSELTKKLNGGNKGITDLNVKEYFIVIEQKISELLLIKNDL
ncbi:coiled-coil domain-containing protein 63-like [Spea bombifrons]|uniref:coiled-coil domain-containing protein 63-like n=1 Tax=Spea bombifrons TaxID=233779 RepID=UPI00234A85C1|nr:coiled-coil domain-containing protein 63-like [Spea bombifrons]